MANIEPRKNKDGKTTSYRIRVFKGRDKNGKKLKPYTLIWKPKSSWNEEKIEKELSKAATIFEKECKEGLAVDTRKTFGQYAQYVIDLKEKIKKKRTIFLEWSFFVGFWVERIAGLADIK